jgi:sodium/proline symporter
MIGYLLLLILWGLYQGRKVRSGADYSIAGRRLPGWTAALSERATGESSWCLLGLPGAAYATGLTEVWTAIGCVAGIVTAWAAIAWRLRDEAERFEVNTFTDYIAKRHADVGSAIRAVGSLTIVFFFFFYVGAQFLGGGKTLHTMFHLDPRMGMLITACIIVPYTVYGGFRSVVYTDVIQAIVMITALIVGPIVGMLAIANAPDVFAHSIPEALAKAGPSHNSLIGAASGFAIGVVIVGGFSWFFGYLGGQPQLSMRFMAIRDADQAKRGRNIGILWTVFAYLGALSIGWIGIALFGPAGLTDQEYVMPRVMLAVFPPAIASILITGAIAAMISTADSLLILSSTELSESLLRKKSSAGDEERSSLVRSRLATLLTAEADLHVGGLRVGRNRRNVLDRDTLHPLLETVSWQGRPRDDYHGHALHHHVDQHGAREDCHRQGDDLCCLRHRSNSRYVYLALFAVIADFGRCSFSLHRGRYILSFID